MPLLDMQRRYRELGRVRLGEKGAKGAPKRRDTFRLTSPNRTLLEHAAVAYGGTVNEWTGAPTEGTQYELCTDADTLQVVIPPGEPLTQHHEMWSGGGCVRRCDGCTELLSGESCLCPADLEARLALAQTGKACKPTTRLSVMLPDIPDIGVWRAESHGVNAAMEMPGTVALLEAALASGRLIPAQLRIDKRTAKKNGQTHHFVVPVLELIGITANTLLTGEAPTPIATPARAALPAGVPKSATGALTTEEEKEPAEPGHDSRIEPGEEGEVGLKPPAAPSTRQTPGQRAIMATARRMDLDDDMRHAVIRHVTEGRCSSVGEVTEVKDGNAVLQGLRDLKAGALAFAFSDDGTCLVTETGEGQ